MYEPQAWACSASLECNAAAAGQGFEKKEQKVKARAATNLAFLYSLEGDASSAQRFADLAVATDKYSAQALVNKVCF